MAYVHRKFLLRQLLDSEEHLPHKEKSETIHCSGCDQPAMPSLLSHPPPPPPDTSNGISLKLTLSLCILGFFFLLIAFLTIIRCRRSSFRRRSTRVSQPLDDDNLRREFIDENQGPVVEHHIWYIRTMGLTQSVIDSIGMFEYKKSEGLVDGSDCAVCLSEFEEDESLRLLPKCSHAFHVPCIDTWLRSHKNCPVCRAPVVTESTNEVNVIEMSSSDNLVTSDDSQTENQSETRSEMGDDDEMRRHDEALFKTRLALEAMERNKGLRVYSDLVDSKVKVDEPVRNSVSMDFDSALTVYEATKIKNGEGSSNSSPRILEKQNNDVISNPSIYRLIKSSSYGRSKQKGPISMKRSASCSGSRFMNKQQSKSQESVPALSELGIRISR